MEDEAEFANYDAPDDDASHPVSQTQLELAMLAMELNLTDRQAAAVTRYSEM